MAVLPQMKQQNKNILRGLIPRANCTNRTTAACQRILCQLFADRGCQVVSVTGPYGRILDFLDWRFDTDSPAKRAPIDFPFFQGRQVSILSNSFTWIVIQDNQKCTDTSTTECKQTD
jgi:hypothetical protein